MFLQRERTKTIDWKSQSGMVYKPWVGPKNLQAGSLADWPTWESVLTEQVKLFLRGFASTRPLVLPAIRPHWSLLPLSSFRLRQGPELRVDPLKVSAMIAQWKNEWISQSVLSVTRVMIAQWENECISQSVLSVARVVTAQWENEWIPQSVLSVARVMIAQWENGCISLFSPWPRFNARQWLSITWDFSLVDHSVSTRPEPAWQKMAQSPLNDTTQPVDSEEEGWSSTMDRRWLKKRCLFTPSSLHLIWCQTLNPKTPFWRERSGALEGSAMMLISLDLNPI